MIRVFLLLLVLLPFSAQAALKTIYVDLNATGANNGTTWADAFTTLSGGTGSFQAGSTNIMLIAAGVYNETITLNLPGQHSGSFGRTNVIKAFTNGVVIDAQGIRNNGVVFQDTKFIRIENFIVRGALNGGVHFFVASSNMAYRIASYKNAQAGFSLQAGDYTVIDHCTSWSNSERGIFGAGDSDYVTVKNCILQQNAYSAVELTGTFGTRLNNNLWGNGWGNATVASEFSSNTLFISIDPTSSDFLRLSSTSPCRNKGTDGSDIGAFPYIVTGPVAPNAPSGVLATALSTNSISVSWNDLSNETSYTLFRNTSRDSNAATKIGLIQDRASYTNTGLVKSTKYYFWVRAYNAVGESPFSAIFSNTTLTPVAPPVVPTGFAAAVFSESQINLSWNDLSNETSYTLFRNTVQDSNFGVTKIGVVANQVSYNNTGLASSQKYFYWIQAYNTAGASGYSASVTNSTLAPPPPPNTPTGVSASVLGSTSISVLWNDLSNETSYTLYRSTSTDSNVATKIGCTLNQTNSVNTGLTPSTLYYFWVRAFNSAGSSGYSARISSTTSNVVSPSTPTGLTATAISSTQIDLAWTDLPNETSYTLFRNTSNSTELIPVKVGFSANQNTYSDTGLPASTQYYYWVKAYNTGGSSAFSSGANATTTAGGTTELGKVIYVSKTGGSHTAPYDTAGKASTNIAAALLEATSGTNTILIVDNYQSYDSFSFINSVNQIMVKAGDGYTPRVSGQTRITIENSRNITIQGLTRMNRNVADFGFFVINSYDIILKKNLVYSNALPGLILDTGAHRVSIISNIFINNDQPAIQVGGVSAYSNLIEGNLISKNAQIGVQFVNSSKYNLMKRNRIQSNIQMGVQFTGTSFSNTVCSNDIVGNMMGVQFTDGAINNLLLGNSVKLSPVNGVQIAGVAAMFNMVKANNIIRNVNHGVVIENGANANLVQGNTIASNGIFGLMFNNAANNLVVSNVFLTNQKGIQVENSKNNYIQGNHSTKNLYQGIALLNATNNIVKENSLYLNGQQGLFLQTALSNKLIGNRVYRNAQQAIFFRTSSGSLVSNNVVMNHTLSAFHLTGPDAANGSHFNQLKNNIMVSNQWGFFVEQGSANNVFDHNTSLRNFTGFELNGTAGTGNSLRNSIFASSYGNFGIADYKISSLDNDYNCVYDSAVQDYGGTMNPHPNSISADPQFVNTTPSSSFYLYVSATSPCAGTASDGSDIGARPSASSLTPARVSGFSATALATNLIALSWSDLSTETSYTLFRYVLNESNNSTPIMGFSAGSTVYTNKNLPKETTYFYWIRAYNEYGASPFSLVASATTFSVPPATPTGLTARMTNLNQSLLQWNDVASESTFRIYRHTANNSSAASLVTSVVSNTTTYLDAGLAYSTVFYYWVRAFKGNTPSDFSLVSVITTGVAPVLLPPAGPDEDGLSVWNNGPKDGERIDIYLNSPDPVQYADSDVRIELYTVGGIFVKEILTEKYSALSRPVSFDPGGLSPGVYILYAKGAGVREYKRIYIRK